MFDSFVNSCSDVIKYEFFLLELNCLGALISLADPVGTKISFIFTEENTCQPASTFSNTALSATNNRAVILRRVIRILDNKILIGSN